MVKKIAVIPAYEPDEKLCELVKEASESNFEIIIVDDGSGEKYKHIFQQSGKYAKVISYEQNHGKGYAMKKALEAISLMEPDMDFTIVVMDCDGQHRVKDALKLCEIAENNIHTLVLGSRRQSYDSPLRSRFGNACTRNVYRVVTGQKVYDTQTGLRAFHANLLVIMSDGSFEIINEGDVDAQTLLDNGARQVLSFGPALVVQSGISISEGEEVGKAMASNPRTAIGIYDDLHYVFVVSDGRTDESEGLSLYQLAEFMQSLGVTTAYNLDGGGSSTMYFNGEIVNNPTTNGKSIKERKVSDIVYVGY